MRRAASKIVSLERAVPVVATWRERGERVVLAHGAFDLLHAAHVQALAAARARGSRLVVAVLDDPAAAGVEGPGRPVLPATDRAALVAALRAVDLVVIIGTTGAEGLDDSLKPDVRAGEADRANVAAEDEVGGEPAGGSAGRPRRASDALIARVRARYGKDG